MEERVFTERVIEDAAREPAGAQIIVGRIGRQLRLNIVYPGFDFAVLLDNAEVANLAEALRSRAASSLLLDFITEPGNTIIELTRQEDDGLLVEFIYRDLDFSLLLSAAQADAFADLLTDQAAALAERYPTAP